MTPPPRRISAKEIAAWLGPRDRAAMALAALGIGGLGLWRQGAWSAPIFAALGALAVAIVLIDLRHFRIPDLLSGPVLALGLVQAVGHPPLWPVLLAMALLWVGLRLLQRGFLALRGRAGLGGGDVKLIVAAAAWIAPQDLPAYLMAAAGSALVLALLIRARRQSPLAFGAHLAPWLVVFALWR